MNEVESLLHELSKIDFQKIERILNQKLAPVWSPPLNEPILKEEDIYILYSPKQRRKVLQPLSGTYFRFAPYLERILKFLSQKLGDRILKKLNKVFGVYGVNSFGEICIIFYLYRIPPGFWYELFETILLELVPLYDKITKYTFAKYVYRDVKNHIKFLNKLYDALGELLKILPQIHGKDVQFNAEMSKDILSLAKQTWKYTPKEFKTIDKDAYDAAIEIMLKYIKRYHPFDFGETAKMILTHIQEEIASAIYYQKQFLTVTEKRKKEGEQIIEEIKKKRVPRTEFRLYAPFTHAFAEKIANFIKKELDESPFCFCQTQFCKNFVSNNCDRFPPPDKGELYCLNKIHTARLLLDILSAMGETFSIRYNGNDKPGSSILTIKEGIDRGKKLKEKLVKNFCATLDSELEVPIIIS